MNFYYYRIKVIGTGSLLIGNLNPSTVLNAENVGLAKLLKDVFGTSLVPDIDNEKIKWSSHCSGIRGLSRAVSVLAVFSKEFSCIQSNI